MDELPVTDRTRLRRRAERGHTDRALLDAILDEAFVAHVGFSARRPQPASPSQPGDGPSFDAQPFVIPTTYVRIGRVLYLHGAVANHMLRAGGAGVELCATVTLLDGLVLARSSFHHSMNYRSVVIMGRAHLVEEAAEKARVLDALVERLIPGRTRIARSPSPEELKTTSVLALPLEEASVKIRTGPPIEEERDRDWPAWTGVIPLALRSGTPQMADGATGNPPARTLAGPVVAGHAAADADQGSFEQRHGDWLLSDDRARIDFARVTTWLAGAYWCAGIPRAAVERAARHSSLVVGAYGAGGDQVGYLRVVSDCTRFANVMDVFVAEAQRRQGLGRALVRFALGHAAHRGISRWQLGTADAHAVYAHEGFGPVTHPERMMQRVTPHAWPAPATKTT